MPISATVGADSAAEQGEGTTLRCDDRELLRAESLSILVLLAFGIAYLWMLYLAVVMRDSVAEPWLGPLGLLVVSGGTYTLSRRRPAVAQVGFPCALMALVILSLWLAPRPFGPFFMVPVILVASVIAARRWMVVLTLAGCMALCAVPFVRGTPSRDTCLAAAFLSVVTALIAWLATRNLHTAVEWAMYSQAQARESVVALRLRRAELRHLSDMLSENQERLHYLNLRLEQAKVAAEEAYRTKQHFVANVSHELRTPLNLITGFGEMMAFSPESYGGVHLPVQYRQDVMEIYRSSRHLLGLVEDVLALAQLEAGQMLIKRDWTPLAPVIHDAVETIRPLIDAKGLNLQIDAPAALPALYLDAGRIRQVLLNLLNNAYRFTDSGFICVRAQCAMGEVVIEVCDSGVGIASTELPAIFEEFRGLGSGVAGDRGGFGLGLSISRRLVEAHGGRLWVESVLGQGTSFYVSIPLEAPADAARPTLVHTAVGDRAKTRGVILAVGRGQGPAEVHRYLGPYQVVHAQPEDLAFALERYLPVAVWSLDAPPDDGVLGNLRQMLRDSPTVPIIECRIPTHADTAHQLQADILLTKPITRDKLLGALQQWTETTDEATILVVDDDVRMLRLLHRTLSTLYPGCRVVEACGGQEGLDLWATEAPDTVLLDLAMPHVSGYDVLGRVHSDPQYRAARIVLVTGAELEGEATPVYRIAVESAAGFSLAKSLKALGLLIGELSSRVAQP